MQNIPTLSDVYAKNKQALDEQAAQNRSEIAKGPYAMQVPITSLPPTSELVARARWKQINGDATYPGDIPSAEQQHIAELKKQIAELESQLQK